MNRIIVASKNCFGSKCVFFCPLPLSFLFFVFHFYLLFPSTPSPHTLAFRSQFAMVFICFEDLLKVSLCHLFSSATFFTFSVVLAVVYVFVYTNASVAVSFCSSVIAVNAFFRCLCSAFIFCRNLICGNCLTCIPKEERNYHWIYTRTNEITFASDYVLWSSQRICSQGIKPALHHMYFSSHLHAQQSTINDSRRDYYGQKRRWAGCANDNEVSGVSEDFCVYIFCLILIEGDFFTKTSHKMSDCSKAHDRCRQWVKLISHHWIDRWLSLFTQHRGVIICRCWTSPNTKFDRINTD